MSRTLPAQWLPREQAATNAAITIGFVKFCVLTLRHDGHARTKPADVLTIHVLLPCPGRMQEEYLQCLMAVFLPPGGKSLL
jgi:hypothetical protein